MGVRGGRTDRAVLCALFGLMLIVGGCSSSRGVKPDSGTAPRVTRGLPGYDDLKDAHNERVSRLDKLWSRMSFVVRRPDPDSPGSTLSDQAEGHVQIQQPSNVSVSLSKLGELFFLLGSNEELYWWIDRTDSSEPIVLFGRHELAGPRTLEWLGVSMAPLELVDLFGITPLPEATEDLDAWVRAEGGGQVSVIVPTRFGYRKLVFDEDRMVRFVELLDATGEVVVRSELGRERRVPVYGDGTPGEFMGTRIRMEFPAEDVFLSVELAEQTNKDLTPIAFDFDRQVRAYGRNGLIYDLDAPPEPEPETEIED